MDTPDAVSIKAERNSAAVPEGSERLRVMIVRENAPAHQVLFRFPPAFQRAAVVGAAQTAPRHESDVALEVLTVPAEHPLAVDRQRQAAAWVDGTAARGNVAQVMTLQGAQVIWNSDRIAILAPADRLPAARKAVVEAFWYEVELARLERTLGDLWPNLERDTPLAFAFDEKSLSRRTELQGRYQQVMGIRWQQACLAPCVHCPHVHPPTLASQISERFRERTRLAHRHEILGEQLEAVERIYETCGQRASEFVQSRTGHMLEWIIIAILLTQILLWGFEILTSLEPVAAIQ